MQHACIQNNRSVIETRACFTHEENACDTKDSSLRSVGEDNQSSVCLVVADIEYYWCFVSVH
jgi:hypothetical protein